MKEPHIMIDLETMGDASRSVITSLSAVCFDMETAEIIDKIEIHVGIQSCQEKGLQVSAKTIMWWISLPDNARRILVEGQNNSVDLERALKQLAAFILKHGGSRVRMWGKSPRFDEGLLHDAYNACKMDIPWDFRKELCVRTMEWLRPALKAKVPFQGIGHSALDDSLYQVKYVCRIWKDLNQLQPVLEV